jgi:pimeloyl-ACP methyl ester carboxylesterase
VTALHKLESLDARALWDQTTHLINCGSYQARVHRLSGPAFRADAPLAAVTVHGLVESQDVWHPIVDDLAHRLHGGFGLSLPWHGKAGCLWGLEAQPEEWLSLCWDTLPAGPKIVLAHSFGANALLGLLCRRVERGQRHALDELAALILVSPYYKTEYTDFGWDYFKSCVDNFDVFLRASVGIRPGAARLRPASVDAILEKIKEKYSSFTWLEFFRLFSRTPGLDLGRLTMPTLILGGDCDVSIPVADLAALTQRLPCAELRILPDCGHFCMTERAAETSRIIDRFLGNLPEERHVAQAH